MVAETAAGWTKPGHHLLSRGAAIETDGDVHPTPLGRGVLHSTNPHRRIELCSVLWLVKIRTTSCWQWSKCTTHLLPLAQNAALSSAQLQPSVQGTIYKPGDYLTVHNDLLHLARGGNRTLRQRRVAVVAQLSSANWDTRCGVCIYRPLVFLSVTESANTVTPLSPRSDRILMRGLCDRRLACVV